MPTSASSIPDGLSANQRAHWVRRQQTARYTLGAAISLGAKGESTSLFRRYVQGEITLTEAIELARQQQYPSRGIQQRNQGRRQSS